MGLLSTRRFGGVPLRHSPNLNLVARPAARGAVFTSSLSPGAPSVRFDCAFAFSPARSAGGEDAAIDHAEIGCFPQRCARGFGLRSQWLRQIASAGTRQRLNDSHVTPV
jgi:hypothetical protein